MSLEALEATTAEMAAKRDQGEVHSGTRPITEPIAAAAAFGLSVGAVAYELDRAQARHVLVWILHRDLAYNDAVMPLAMAEQLAEAFVEQASALDCRVYGNSHDRFGTPSRSWTPATEATLDSGVLAVGPHGSACMWVEDED